MTLSHIFEREDVKTRIEELIRKHHELYDGKVDGLHWEELSYKALTYCGVDTVYENGSHSIGTDIVIDNMNVSYKSGLSLHKKRMDKHFYVYSGSRTTKHKTLTEKIAFLTSSDVTDFAFCEATPTKVDDKVVKWDYTLRTMSHTQIPYDTLEFDYDDDSGIPIPTTITGKDINSEFVCKINKSMSSQIWYWVPLEWLTVVQSFEVTLI